MRVSARLLFLPLTAALLLLSGCFYAGDWGDAYHEDFHSTRALAAGGTVSVETFNGSIEIMGWEQNSVEINGTKSAGTKDALDEIKIDYSVTPGSVRIKVIRPSDFGWRRGGVRLALRVPHKVVLDLISTSNGKIQVEDIEGNARLHTSNGGIRLSRIKGDVEARTSNGTIEADGIDGNTHFHTSNGGIRAESTNGSFEGTTSNGSITARLRDPATTWPVRVESSNGHIELTLDGKVLPEVRASTSNSSILLRLPASANARVRASTSHSPITTEFDELGSDRGRRRSELEGTIGRGGPLMDLRSNNGGIKIVKL